MTLRFDCRHRYASGFELAAAFEAGDGVTALVGPSGSGKTTALQILAGILQPSSGTIVLGDRTLLDTSRGIFVAPEQRQIGVVFQDHLLFPHRTVRENLRYGADRNPAMPVDFASVVELLEIGDLLDRLPQALSGGQRQRVALGRAILRGPKLLLMDEPLAALDSALKARVLAQLERVLAAWRIPTLLVTHDERDVARLAERTIVLESGRVAAEQ